MPGAKPLLITVPLLASIVVSALLFQRSSDALQTPRMALDMAIAGTTYDEASNTMVLGPIENCLTTAPSGNNAQHNHTVHLILQDAVDIVGWQARLNYDGGRMRPSTVNFTPFADGARGQNVSFTNLPIDAATGVHRDLVSASNIPPAAAGAQTALVGAVYQGSQNPSISPDTPAKVPPDDTSYNAPGGGVLAALTLQVLPGQAGQTSLTMDLDDANPNPPGSDLQVFTGTGIGIETVSIPESGLFDGFHAEGASCVPAPGIPPVPADDPGFPDSPPGGGTAVPGATSPGGGSPGAGTSSSGGASPTLTATSPTSDGETPDDADKPHGGNDEDDDGTPFWLYLLPVIVIALAAGGALAWRYRSRLPWFRP